jgi:hypothetical protein
MAKIFAGSSVAVFEVASDLSLGESCKIDGTD